MVIISDSSILRRPKLILIFRLGLPSDFEFNFCGQRCKFWPLHYLDSEAVQTVCSPLYPFSLSLNSILALFRACYRTSSPKLDKKLNSSDL